MPAALAVAVMLLLAPSAAQAGASGSAYFQRATGGTFTAPLPADGLKVYSASPAYIVLRNTAATASIERYASIQNFSWVAVPDQTPGHKGTSCFRDGHLLTFPVLVDSFVEGPLKYHGLFLQYSTSYFRRGDLNPRHCSLIRSGPIVPTVTLSRTQANLHFDCLTRSCRGNFAVFRSASGCSGPTNVLPSVPGCQPVLHGRFFAPGGTSVLFGIPVPLFGLRFASMAFAITVNGKLQPRSPLRSLKPIQPTPARPRRASITTRCGAGGMVRSPVSVTGSLTPGGARALVTLTFTGPSGASSSTTTTVMSTPGGAYAAPFTPRSAGKWTVKASFIGDRSRTSASSRSCSFSVTALGPLPHVPPPRENR